GRDVRGEFVDESAELLELELDPRLERNPSRIARNRRIGHRRRTSLPGGRAVRALSGTLVNGGDHSRARGNPKRSGERFFDPERAATGGRPRLRRIRYREIFPASGTPSLAGPSGRSEFPAPRPAGKGSAPPWPLDEPRAIRTAAIPRSR